MKTDHRKRYTKKVIHEAFLSLLRQKPVEKITISDVCALAEIIEGFLLCGLSGCVG